MKLKKILSFAGLTVVAATILAACSANNTTTTDSSSSESSSAAEKTKLVVGTNASPKPFNYEDKDGNLTGYEAEVVRAIFDGSDYEVEFNVTEWSSIFANLDSGRNQLAVNNISFTEERSEKYLYSVPVASNPLSLIVPKDSEIKSLDDIAGKATEVVQGTTTAAQLEKHNEENADKQTEIRYTRDSIQSILNRLNDGQSDYKLFEGITAQAIIDDQGLDNLKVIDLPVEEAPYIYIIFADDQKELRDFANDRLKELEKDGTLAELSEKFLGGNHVPKADELKSPN